MALPVVGPFGVFDGMQLPCSGIILVPRGPYHLGVQCPQSLGSGSRADIAAPDQNAMPIAPRAGRLLAEQNEIWAERRYLDMDEFREWRATRQPTHAGGNIVAPSEKRDAITGSNLQQNLDLTVPGYFLGAW